MGPINGVKGLTDDKVCPVCSGTGIESYYNHGYGEHSVEPIKCKECDGFGRVQEEE